MTTTTIPSADKLKLTQPRVFSFQPSDEVRVIVTLAEEILGMGRTELLNNVCLAALPSWIETRANERATRLTDLMAEFKTIANTPAIKGIAMKNIAIPQPKPVGQSSRRSRKLAKPLPPVA